MALPREFEKRLTKQRRVAEEEDAKRRAKRLRFPYVDLISTGIPTEIAAMSLVPRTEAEHALVAPLQITSGGKRLAIAAYDPTTAEARAIIDQLKKEFKVETYVASVTSLKHIFSYYQYVSEETKEISGKVEIDQAHLTELLQSLKTLDSLHGAIQNFSSPLVSQVLEVILAGALALHASDIHLEPTANHGVLRLRIDGMLHTAYDALPLGTYKSVTTRIKLLSNLKLNIHHEAQDGRFTISMPSGDIEIRTSVIPSEFGETLVLRLLDPHAISVDLESLGWRPDDLEIVKRTLTQPNGLILNTGPTGSGKTTTLYAFLKYTFKPEIKVITIEDPVEYHLEGISQTQVNEDSGYTFASGLRSVLRQDPNIILVGEIRDRETAEIAMNAALTGHTVFSTLHTNDAVGAIPRLIDLGAKPQILGPALSLVIAQRLVRLLCPHCKKATSVSKKTLSNITEFLGRLPKRVDRSPYATPTLFEAGGCDACGSLGYRRRTSVFELFTVDEKMEQAIYQNPTEIELKALSKTQGMTTMQEDGVLKALRGLTSIGEVERLTGPIEWLRG